MVIANNSSLHLAFGFIQSSYDLMERRLQAVEARIQMLLGLAGALTVAVPVFAASLTSNPDFSTPLFYAAVGAFLLLVLSGLLTIDLGEITLVDSGKFDDQEWLDLCDAQFKKQMITFAGVHFQKNRRLVNLKGHAATFLSVLFAGQVLLVTLWIVGQT